MLGAIYGGRKESDVLQKEIIMIGPCLKRKRVSKHSPTKNKVRFNFCKAILLFLHSETGAEQRDNTLRIIAGKRLDDRHCIKTKTQALVLNIVRHLFTVTLFLKKKIPRQLQFKYCF